MARWDTPQGRNAEAQARYDRAAAHFYLAAARLAARARKYSPDQPRAPAGNPAGGQWTGEGAEGRIGARSSRRHTKAPHDAVTYRAGDGTHFDAPPDADFQKIHMYGQSLRGKPISDQIAAIRAAIAQNGIFDFQRSNGIFISDYQNASNYGVGVLMNGAGYSWFDTFMMATGYGFLNSKPAYDPKRVSWWYRGYRDAANSMLPQ